MSTNEQQRAEAKLKAAVAAMEPAMQAALAAAHELMALNPDDAHNDFSRVMLLGLISQVLGGLYPAQVRVLCDLVCKYFAVEKPYDWRDVADGRHQH